MLCPQCGKNVGDIPKLCPTCQQELEDRKNPKKAESGEGDPTGFGSVQPDKRASFAGFGGFWLRFFAYLFDGAILTLPSTLIGLLLTPRFFESIKDFAASFANSGSMAVIMIFTVLVGALVGVLVQLMISLLYFPLFESSAYQATPGKMLFKLIVVDGDGERLSRSQSFLRALARWTPLFPFLLGIGLALIFKAGLDAPNAASACAMVGLLVTSLLSLIQYPMAGFTEGKQAFHDLLAQTYVVRREQMSNGETVGKAIFSIIFVIIINHYFGPKKERHSFQSSFEYNEQSIQLSSRREARFGDEMTNLPFLTRF